MYEKIPMLNEHIAIEIEKQLEFSPSDEQKQLIKLLSEFILPASKNDILLLKGYAGTGKSSIVSAFVKMLSSFKMKSVLLAPTGRAAKVIASYSGKPAYTIHKKIYRQQKGSDGLGKFVLSANLHSNTIFVVDEASMISNRSDGLAGFGSGRLLDDLIQYVFSGNNCKLIFVGDTAQLPPVGSLLSPALDIKELELFGKNVTQIVLKKVFRQKEQSGILHNATLIRNKITGNDISFPKLEYTYFNDVERITGEFLIETISTEYDQNGIENCMVVTRSNKRANLFNAGIRASILYREEQLTSGDLIMVVKNNYFWLPENKYTDFIANGDIAEVIKIYDYENLYDLHFVNVKLKFIDYPDIEIKAKIILDSLSYETASMTKEQNLEFYNKVMEDYADISSKKERYKKLKENPYFNALQVKFSYAVTCHKAQGGQWNTVFIDHGYIPDNKIDMDFLRWLYTAFTRAKSKIYLVNFSKEFFEEPTIQ